MRVRLTSVSKSFGSATVLRELDLEWSSPAAVALMGPSGSGKSTILGIVAGALAPDAGSVEITTEHAHPPRVAWIVQNTPMLERRSAIDNVVLGAVAVGTPRAEAFDIAKEAMAMLGVEQLAATRTYRLSGGERQRVAVARAIASSADLILADEPTASLDARNRDLVTEALVTSARAGALVIIATHDQRVADRCDDVFELRAASNADSHALEG